MCKEAMTEPVNETQLLKEIQMKTRHRVGKGRLLAIVWERKLNYIL